MLSIKHYTGASNRLVLKNLKKISQAGKPIMIRIPLIPGITDTNENLSGLKHIIEQTKGIRRIDLLPYHATAKSKYERMGKTCWQASRKQLRSVKSRK
jgi:pyruvate formate lyase activating enzyme